jgi:HD superfamily phosphodiesterase
MNELKTQIEKTMVDYLDGDSRRIAHARQVTAFVEQLVAQEQGDYIIVMAAGLLHDIGIHEAERKYHSNAGNYQEIEGPPIARSILQELGMSAGQIEEVCEIIAHHHSPGIINSRNFKILYDADWLVNLGDEFDIQDKTKISGLIDKIFLTAGGKVLAKQIYLNSPSTL